MGQRTLWLAVVASFVFCAGSASAQMTSCRLRYELSGWSFIYKEYRGVGTVTCRNGETARVSLVARGAGLTVGSSKIDNGRGAFSEVRSIDEVFGTYFSVDGHAGATRAAEGYAMTKGPVSLALSGVGRGIDLGVAFSGFTIRRR